MVDINGKSYSDIIKIKGTDKKIDLTKLEGLQRTEQNKAIFDMADKNKDGVIDKKEVQILQGNLLTGSGGNGKISQREANRNYGEQMNAFDAINALADQQKAFEEGKEYIETNGNKSTHYSKGYSYTEVKDGETIHHTVKGVSYTQETDQNGAVTTTLDDGTQEIQFKDGTSQQIKTDGTIITYDKNGNKTSVMANGNTTTFPDENTSITKNLDGQTIQTVTVKDGAIVRTDFEYQDGKTIEREFSDVGDDAPLTSITVKEKRDGHNIDTKFATEEDMANNKPSEIVTDAHNPTQKTVTKFTYNEDGTYSTETTDSAGKKTVKNFNADGTEIVKEQKPEVPTTHTVVKGESITQIIKDALSQQGIENPTPEQLKEAKKEFLELNKDLVKTYKGVKKEWHGNKFFYPDDVVKIPTFVKEEAAAPVKDNNTVENNDNTVEQISGNTDPKDVKIPEETKARQAELQEIFGPENKVEIAEDGTFVVKDTNGNILPEATKMANGATDNDSEINLMMAYDGDGSTSLDINEYTNFIIEFMGEAGVTIDDSNREQILNLIQNDFNSMDVKDKNGALTKAELKEHAERVIGNFADSVNKILNTPTEPIDETEKENAAPASKQKDSLTQEEINAKIKSLKPGESYSYQLKTSVSWGSGSNYESKPITWTRNEDGTLTKTVPDFVHVKGKTLTNNYSTTYTSDGKTVILYEQMPEGLYHMQEIVSTRHFENGKATHLSTDLSNLDQTLIKDTTTNATPVAKLMSSLKQQAPATQAKFSNQEIKNSNGETVVTYKDGKFFNAKGNEINYGKAAKIINELYKNNELGSLIQTFKADDAE